MKTFTKIPNQIGTLFKPTDVYTIAVMYLTAKYDINTDCFVTDSTREQLAEFTGLSFNYIKLEFLPRFKESKFCEIVQYTDSNNNRRNRYYLPNPEVNYRIINSRVIHDISLTPREKGFLISLFTICENNTFNCGLNTLEITDLLKISKTTFGRYKEHLINKGKLLTFDNEDLFDHFKYSSCLEINCDWIGSTSNDINHLKTENYRKASNYCFLIHSAA